MAARTYDPDCCGIRCRLSEVSESFPESVNEITKIEALRRHRLIESPAGPPNLDTWRRPQPRDLVVSCRALACLVMGLLRCPGNTSNLSWALESSPRCTARRCGGAEHLPLGTRRRRTEIGSVARRLSAHPCRAGQPPPGPPDPAPHRGVARPARVLDHHQPVQLGSARTPRSWPPSSGSPPMRFAAT